MVERKSFQSLEDKFQRAIMIKTKKKESQDVFLLNNERTENRHPSLTLTSLHEPGPSVICQQPGTETEMWGRWAWTGRGRVERETREEESKNKHETRLKFLGRKAMWPWEGGKTVENQSDISCFSVFHGGISYFPQQFAWNGKAGIKHMPHVRFYPHVRHVYSDLLQVQA